jgi:alpha-tubulin suppressor-like RCC1 family protein
MWGEAHWGQLGLPEYSETHQAIPARCVVRDESGAEVKIVKLSCGGTHTAALSDEGHVYVWGRCDSGQLGLGEEWIREISDQGRLFVSTPHRVDGFNGEKVVQVACGAFHTAAVTASGAVYIWGKEDYGMLGVGQCSDLHTPVRLEFFDEKPAL